MAVKCGERGRGARAVADVDEKHQAQMILDNSVVCMRVRVRLLIVILLLSWLYSSLYNAKLLGARIILNFPTTMI
ncbi:hypothetical protein L228DRAFT_170937 [Xylona heveae TC161]|uniref:Uncharacterized protein n=1 Tax=Xylona heveae (strain CBS 132557 / TC161) TaxID=1328760 RepID=A0A165FTC9_XYLHT|nr:hypothetical protein L228DRAFT_170937 [Xylona heveae TC161]KZF21352.1 hypothetical protein L228DRAFT_170937 [Xylona heveae TC161]